MTKHDQRQYYAVVTEEMLVAKRKDLALNVLMLTLSQAATRAFITLIIIEIMTANVKALLPKSALDMAPIFPFGVVALSKGACYQDIDLAALFCD